MYLIWQADKLTLEIQVETSWKWAWKSKVVIIIGYPHRIKYIFYLAIFFLLGRQVKNI